LSLACLRRHGVGLGGLTWLVLVCVFCVFRVFWPWPCVLCAVVVVWKGRKSLLSNHGNGSRASVQCQTECYVIRNQCSGLKICVCCSENSLYSIVPSVFDLTYLSVERPTQPKEERIKHTRKRRPNTKTRQRREKNRANSKARHSQDKTNTKQDHPRYPIDTSKWRKCYDIRNKTHNTTQSQSLDKRRILFRYTGPNCYRSTPRTV
jgi:hypothetical protein